MVIPWQGLFDQIRKLYRLSSNRRSRAAIDTQFETGIFCLCEIKYSQCHWKQWNNMIVPYIYEDASKYYETLFYAHQANKGIENIDIDKITIKIRSPERKVKKMKTIDLSYLEEGEMS